MASSIPASPATLPGAFPATVKKLWRGGLRPEAEEPTPAPRRTALLPPTHRDAPLRRPSPPRERPPASTPPELLEQPSHLVLDDPFAGEDLSDVEPDNSIAVFPQDVASGAGSLDDDELGVEDAWREKEAERPDVLARTRGTESTQTLAPDAAEHAKQGDVSFGFPQFDPWASPRGARRPAGITETPAPARAARLAHLHALRTPMNKLGSPFTVRTPRSAAKTPMVEAETVMNDSVKDMLQKQLADLREFADHEIDFRDEMISELQRNVDSLRQTNAAAKEQMSVLEGENRLLAEESEQRMRRIMELDLALQSAQAQKDREEQKESMADLERDLRRASLATEAESKRHVAELSAQLQELSDLYEAEIHKRSDAEKQALELEEASERQREDHAAELQACRDHANAHVALYRRKCADLKSKLLGLSDFVCRVRETLAESAAVSGDASLRQLLEESEGTTVYTTSSMVDVAFPFSTPTTHI